MANFNLSIPTPCSEKWKNFVPTEKGGFCKICFKEVVDFSTMSDEEIKAYFSSVTKSTCGRFRNDQLKTYSDNKRFNPIPRITLLKAAVASFFILFFSRNSLAQEKTGEPRIECFQRLENPVNESVAHSNSIIVSGIVISAEDNLPVPGVNILLKGTFQGTVTDNKGRFTLPLKLQEADTLVFTFIGYKSQEHKLRSVKHDEYMTITMEPEHHILMGELLIVTRKVSFRRWWWNLKALFI